MVLICNYCKDVKKGVKILDYCEIKKIFFVEIIEGKIFLYVFFICVIKMFDYYKGG